MSRSPTTPWSRCPEAGRASCPPTWASASGCTANRGAARFLRLIRFAGLLFGRACQRAGCHRGVARRPAGEPRHAQAAGPGRRARPVRRATLSRRHPRRPALGRLAARRRHRHAPGVRARLRRALEPDRAPRAPARCWSPTGPATPCTCPTTRSTPPASSRRSPTCTSGSAAGSPVGPAALIRDELAATVRDLNEALSLWRGVPYAELEDAAAAGRAGPARGAARDGARGPGGGRARARPARHGRRRARGADVDVPAARAAVGPARRGPDPGRTTGRRARGAAPGAGACSPRSSGSSPAPSCARCRPPCCGRTRPRWASPGGTTMVPAPAPARRRSRHRADARAVRPTSGLAARRPRRPARRPGRAARPVRGAAGLRGRSPATRASARAGCAPSWPRLAAGEGVTVLVGRCSQDEGAPPLYPWAQRAPRARPRPRRRRAPDGDDGARFRAWEAIARTGARRRPRAPARGARRPALGRHLDPAGAAPARRDRGDRPADGGRHLAARAAAHRRARRGRRDRWPVGTRCGCELTGLTADEAARDRHLRGRGDADRDEADALRVRTDGNPFFLVEYARLARDGGDLSALLAEDDPPAAVHDVLARRLGGLPEGQPPALRWPASSAGSSTCRRWRGVSTSTEDDVLDDLDPALEAGLVREDGVDRFRFAHALVRDTVYAALSRTRRARMHARVAEVLDGQPGRESEVARHWLAAGPRTPARAWRAAGAAAGRPAASTPTTRRRTCCSAAVESIGHDADATPQDTVRPADGPRRAHRRRGALVDLLETVEQALAIAEELDDVRPAGPASSAMTTNALWQSADYGQTTTRSSRCCAGHSTGSRRGRRGSAAGRWSGLANEIYYGTTFASARRCRRRRSRWPAGSGTTSSVLRRVQVGFVGAVASRHRRAAPGAGERGEAIASPDRERDGLRRGLDADRRGARRVRSTWREMWATGRRGPRAGRAAHLPTACWSSTALELPWQAMRGRVRRGRRAARPDGVAPRAHRRCRRAATRSSARLMTLRSGGRGDELAPALLAVRGRPVMPITSTCCVILLRSARSRGPATTRPSTRSDLDDVDWFSTMIWAWRPRRALRTGRRRPRGRGVRGARAVRGRPASAGLRQRDRSGRRVPRDGRRGDRRRDLATRHADDALRLCEEWQIPLAARWLRDQRERFGF